MDAVLGEYRPHLAIVRLSNGELYTFVTNRDACTRECSLVAVGQELVKEDVLAYCNELTKKSRYAVKEVTLDLSDSARLYGLHFLKPTV